MLRLPVLEAVLSSVRCCCADAQTCLVQLAAPCCVLSAVAESPARSFDEVHFGGFASKYVNQRFFMDVHPPLAKLLLAFVAWAAGFNGAFDFKEIGR